MLSNSVDINKHGKPKNNATMYSPPPGATGRNSNTAIHIGNCINIEVSNNTMPDTDTTQAAGVGGYFARAFNLTNTR